RGPAEGGVETRLEMPEAAVEGTPGWRNRQTPRTKKSAAAWAFPKMARATISTMAPGRPPRHERAHKKGGGRCRRPYRSLPPLSKGPPCPIFAKDPRPPYAPQA